MAEVKIVSPQIIIAPSYKKSDKGRKLWMVMMQIGSRGFHFDFHGNITSARKYVANLRIALRESGAL